MKSIQTNNNKKSNNSTFVNFGQFIEQFMSSNDVPFVYEQSPIQIFPLNIASTYINAPIAIFRADYNFLLLFTDGGGQQQVDYDVYELKSNDVLFIREGHLNAINSINPNTDGYYIYIDSLILNQIFKDKTTLNRFSFNPKHSVSKADMEWLCKCCELMTLQHNNSNLLKEINVSLLKVIVLKLAETWLDGTKKTDRQSEITMNFKELVYENFIERREVSFYSNLLAVSENYLNRCVKNVTQKSPKQHINELLINHSMLLLQDSSKDISQIAFELNFTHPSYFGRLFKQVTKQTPTEYRDLLMHDLSE